MRPGAAGAWLIAAEQAAGSIGKAAERAALELAATDRLELGQDPLAGDQGGLVAAFGSHEHGGRGDGA